VAADNEDGGLRVSSRIAADAAPTGKSSASGLQGVEALLAAGRPLPSRPAASRELSSMRIVLERSTPFIALYMWVLIIQAGV